MRLVGNITAETTKQGQKQDFGWTRLVKVTNEMKQIWATVIEARRGERRWGAEGLDGTSSDAEAKEVR